MTIRKPTHNKLPGARDDGGMKRWQTLGVDHARHGRAYKNCCSHCISDLQCTCYTILWCHGKLIRAVNILINISGCWQCVCVIQTPTVTWKITIPTSYDIRCVACTYQHQFQLDYIKFGPWGFVLLHEWNILRHNLDTGNNKNNHFLALALVTEKNNSPLCPVLLPIQKSHTSDDQDSLNN
jgi:hypothetical protein